MFEKIVEENNWTSKLDMFKKKKTLGNPQWEMEIHNKKIKKMDEDKDNWIKAFYI